MNFYQDTIDKFKCDITIDIKYNNYKSATNNIRRMGIIMFSKNDNCHMLKYYLDKNVHNNDDLYIALRIAADAGNLDCVKVLIEYGADGNKLARKPVFYCQPYYTKHQHIIDYFATLNIHLLGFNSLRCIFNYANSKQAIGKEYY
jgi:ankyrin repeat protein